MNKQEKEEIVAWFNGELSSAEAIVITRQKGLTVAQVSDLRGKARKSGTGYKVMKNTLARIALKGTKFEGLADKFEGPTAVAYSKDPVAAAKVVVEFANSNDKIEVVAGAMGDKILSVAEVKALATLPSLDQLRGKIIGLIQAPAQKIASIVQAPAAQVARVISAFGNKS